MEVKGYSIKFLCAMQVLEIPFFQRSYVLKEENWSELLNELLKGELQFLGSIIIKWQKEDKNGIKVATVVDGQQRLTTISILIKALYDCMKEERKNIQETARNALFYKIDEVKADYYLSIRHSSFDSKAFKKVIGEVQEDSSISSPILNELDKIKKDDENAKIERCYKYFYQELEKIYEEDHEAVCNLWRFIFRENNKILAIIEVSEGEEEQKIFDTINSAGVKLSFAEIVKNSIYQRLKQLTEDENSGSEEQVIEFYKDTWQETFERDKKTIAYWSSEKKKEAGHLIDQNIELFLFSYATIKGFFSYAENDSRSKLSERYKDHLKTIKNKKDCETFILELIRYATIYRDHILELESKEVFTFNDVERRLFKILDSQNITSYHPYILYLFEKYENDQEHLHSALNMLERFVVKSLILKDTKNSGKNCEDFIKNTDGSLIRRKCVEISNSRLKEKIKSEVNNGVGKMLLFWIELYRMHKDSMHDASNAGLCYDYELEHIMPKKWQEYWDKVPFVDENNEEITDSIVGNLRRENSITSLGNMTLLTSRLNRDIRNYSFKKKIKGDGKKNGIEKYASLSITKKDIISDIYDKGIKWNECTIARRADKLGDEIIEIWGNKS